MPYVVKSTRKCVTNENFWVNSTYVIEMIFIQRKTRKHVSPNMKLS